ncbi:MAG: glycerol-3-phosphate 1-O-acyltransferase PlsY [Nitrospiraceae bacterium]
MTEGALSVGLIAAAYLIGAVPFGVMVCRLLGHPDPRTVGSRNIGFTNVLRIAGKKAGILTLIGDMGKGWMPASLASGWLSDPWAVAAVALVAVLGHLFPIYLGFKGGKGVATALGAITGVAPAIGGLLLLTWLSVAAIWRYSSGAAISAFALLPALALWKGGLSFIALSFVVSALILSRHRANMARLWNGTEPKIGSSGGSSTSGIASPAA